MERTPFMNAGIHPFQPETEFETAERCFITEMANDTTDPGLSIARARVEPGITTAWHKLTNTAERYLIIEGQGKMELDGLAPTAVCAGDVVRIPPNIPQRIKNTGDRDLLFFAVCTPRFQESCYVALE